MTVLLLVGAKGVGKSWVAGVIAQPLDFHHIDTDTLILERMAAGEAPDRDLGWLTQVERASTEALREHPRVSVEATGAWETDYTLATNLQSKGDRVVRVLIEAPEAETMRRLRERTTTKAPVSEPEARRIYAASASNAEVRSWDLVLDLSGPISPEVVVSAIAAVLGE